MCHDRDIAGPGGGGQQRVDRLDNAALRVHRPLPPADAFTGPGEELVRHRLELGPGQVSGA